jgi:hypothetical protein
MTASAFLDPDHAPDLRQLHGMLGEVAAARWDELTATLEGDFGAHQRLRWDGRRYGWSVPFTRAGRPFVTLTPERGGFGALVVLGRSEADAAGGLTLGEQARDAFATSPQLHDGRWIFLTIASADDVSDLLRLLSVKLPPRVRARLAVARPRVPA